MPWFELETDFNIHSSQFAEVKIHQEAPGRLFLQITLKDGRVFYRGPFSTKLAAEAALTIIKGGTA